MSTLPELLDEYGKCERREGFYMAPYSTPTTREWNDAKLETAAARRAIEDRGAALLRSLEWLVHNFDPKTRNGDWACLECRPHSDMIKDGFQCAWHLGLSILKDMRP